MRLFILLTIALSFPLSASASALSSECAVTSHLDNAASPAPNSLRIRVRAFNSAVNRGCRAKIILNTDVNLTAPLDAFNNTQATNFVLEGGGSPKTINLNGVAGTCGLTVSSPNVTLRNLRIINGNGQGMAALCLQSQNATVENVTFENNAKAVLISGTNNKVWRSFFRNNQGAGIELQSAQNRISFSGTDSNSFSEPTASAVVSPLNAIVPRMELGIIQPDSRYTVFITFDPAQANAAAQVQRVDLYRKNNREVNGTTYVASAENFNLQTAQLEFDGRSSDQIFAVASTSDSTSAPSQALSLSEVASNPANPGNPNTPFNCQPANCFPGVTPPQLRDQDCDNIPDHIEDANRNCQWDRATETNFLTADSDGDGIADGVEDSQNHNGVFEPDLGETDPRSADTDSDGISDGDEDQNKNGRWTGDSSRESNPRSQDTDSDGIRDNLEDRNRNGLWDAGETKAFDSDTDLDGLADGVEDLNRNGMVDRGESDPREWDTDDDGLADNADPCPANDSSFCQEQCVPRGSATSNPNPSSGVSTGNGLGSGLRPRLPGFNPPRIIVIGPSTRVRLDSDRDGLYDEEEDYNRDCLMTGEETDPYSPDTDEDGLYDAQDPCPVNPDADCAGACRQGAFIPSTYDADGDGIPNKSEDVNANCRRDGNETNAYGNDTDGDGIWDGIEVEYGLNPLLKDSDTDGIEDGEEDYNQDGIVQPGETDPKRADSDGDGVRDLNDACPLSTDSTCEDECIVGREPPLRKDSDGDGVPDLLEDADSDCFRSPQETNPFNPDTDGDGVTDGVEDLNRNGLADSGETDPKKRDTDGDGILDGAEDQNRNGLHDFGECNPLSLDTDGDGISDFVEDRNKNGDREDNETSCFQADTDLDGLPDNAEDANRNGLVDAGETDPKRADTDGDGALDGQDANPILSRSQDLNDLTGRGGGCSLQHGAPAKSGLALLGMVLVGIVLAAVRPASDQ